jgi:hypothetical protein
MATVVLRKVTRRPRAGRVVGALARGEQFDPPVVQLECLGQFVSASSTTVRHSISQVVK